jgi:hypothetical protein
MPLTRICQVPIWSITGRNRTRKQVAGKKRVARHQTTSRLDPTTAAAGGTSSHGSVATLKLVEHIEAQNCAGEPEAGAQEGKGLVGLPLAACVVVIQAAPLEGTAAVDLVDPVDEDTEGGEPGSGHDQIEGVMHECRSEWKKPDQREQSAQGGDDFSVDSASQWVDAILVMLV